MSNASINTAIRKKSLDLLTQAALAPHDQAMAAWREWRAAYDIDKTPWPDVRMLGAVAARIAMLEPDASIRPRIVGVRKFLWVQSQICLRHAAGGLAALQRAGVPVLLMKGAARIASDPASAQERLIRDVDVLVPPDKQQQAFDMLRDEGWLLVPEKWQIEWHKWAPVAAHHAWSMSKGKSEIDLHHFSNHLNRLRGDDDGLWARSLTLEWRGVTIRVPSPADALMLALTHGVRWSQDSSADWAVDASALLDAGNVDWDVFLAEAKARMLQVVLLSGLDYLSNVLHKHVPHEVLDSLQATVIFEQLAEMKQYVSTAIPFTEQQTSTAMFMAVQRVMPHAQRFAGKSGSKGQPQLLASSSIKLSATNRKCTIKLPSQLDKFGQIIIQVMIAGPDELGTEPFACTITAPGLTLGVLVSKQLSAQQPDSPQVAILTVPELLLGLRDIRDLRFSFRMKNYRGGSSVTISILRDE